MQGAASAVSRFQRLLYNLYLEGRAIAARYDWLYPQLIRAISLIRPEQRPLLISRDTEIVIEGFPRSANTYLVAFLLVAQGRTVRIARHLHESYQVRFAERYKIPCIVLLRAPLEAVVSAVGRNPRTSPGSILRNYIRFYEEVLRVHQRAVIASFDIVVNDANLVIEEVNAVYGTSFLLLPASELERVAQEVAAMDRKAFDTTELDPLRIAAPSEQKRAARAVLEPILKENFSALLAKAGRLHSQVEGLSFDKTRASLSEQPSHRMQDLNSSSNDPSVGGRTVPSAVGRAVKKSIQAVVRRAHIHLFDRGLPNCVAVYFHGLAEAEYTQFESMVSYFRDHGYSAVTQEEYVSDKPNARRLFISFDDNFRDWHRALSLFQKLDIKVAFYANSLPLRDRAKSAEIAKYFERVNQPRGTLSLSSGELRDLASHGHSIGSHTYSHQLLSIMPIDEAKEEVRRGKAELEDILGRPVVHFSFPFGMRRHFPQGLVDYCRDLGIETVATAIPGLLHSPQQPLYINRTGWNLTQPLSSNLANIRLDGAWFERVTGRSAVGTVFPDATT